MGRASTQIVIFLVLLTAASNAIMVSGVGAALEISPGTGAEDEVQEVQDEADSIEPAQGTSETLFTMYTSTTQTFETIFTFVFAAPLMFINLGVPSWLTAMFFAPMAIIVAADIVHLLTGRDP